MTRDTESPRDLSPICANFSVVRQFDDPDRVVEIRDTIVGLGQDEISRASINTKLESPLTTKEAAALFTCLQKNGAATQIATDERGFADYTFEVRLDDVSRILTQQAATISYQAFSDRSKQNESSVEFIATLPGGFEAKSTQVHALRDIASTLRDQVFAANSSIRIANPYFDPSLELVEDLASLPQRGVETCLLTRETADKQGDTRATLNRMWELMDAENRENFEVRDLYEWDESIGAQAFATHAKIVIVDDTVCYVGSANLTDTSLSTNFEFGVVVEGEIVSDAATVYDEVFNYARPVDLSL